MPLSRLWPATSDDPFCRSAAEESPEKLYSKLDTWSRQGMFPQHFPNHTFSFLITVGPHVAFSSCYLVISVPPPLTLREWKNQAVSVLRDASLWTATLQEPEKQAPLSSPCFLLTHRISGGACRRRLLEASPAGQLPIYSQRDERKQRKKQTQERMEARMWRKGT